VLLIGSSNALIGFDRGIEILRAGGSALDAVEAVTRVVEDNPEDHTVGYGGIPNLEGVVELDASIMEGATHQAGCVGGLRGYRAAITVARAVMERLPHVLVVGEGAARLAAEIGLAEEEMLSPEAEHIWRDGIEGRLDKSSALANMAAAVAGLRTPPVDAEIDAGTVDVIAQDGQRRIVSAVSTSGWGWKYPGRLGDTPVLGAGNWCDDRHGAAACTGLGELAVRAGTARSAVEAMARGAGAPDAAKAALEDLRLLEPPAGASMNVVVVKADGTHAAGSLSAGATYAVWEAEMAAGELRPRVHVPLS
jgi:L-asparaginase / beta-aspartyl-peptidase